MLAGLLITGSVFATVYKYYIKCKDGTEQTGWLSAPTTSDAFEMLVIWPMICVAKTY